MTPQELFFFSDELQKVAGISSTTAMQDPASASATQEQPKKKKKKKNIITRNLGLGSVAATVGAGLLALKNPAAAAKYLGRVKDVVARPGTALKRGFRSGASDIMEGPGASDAVSKRVGLLKEVLRSADEGRLTSVKALDDIAAGQRTARTRGFGNVGKMSAEGDLALPGPLKQEVSETLGRLDAGEIVPESELADLYSRIQRSGSEQGLELKKNFGYSFLPGERTVELGFGAVPGAALGALESEDPETGRKRGIAERIARGTVGGATGMAISPLAFGRGARLSSRNLLTGERGSMISQKTLLPLAASVPLMGAGAIATDVAGAGGSLVDRAFGQKE